MSLNLAIVGLIVAYFVLFCQFFFLLCVITAKFDSLVNPLHSSNVKLPMLVTVLGIVMFSRLVQPENAELAILLPLVITTVFNDAGMNVF